jgi:hypothetical protein
MRINELIKLLLLLFNIKFIILFINQIPSINFLCILYLALFAIKEQQSYSYREYKVLLSQAFIIQLLKSFIGESFPIE